MRIVSRGRGTKVILEESDLAKLIEEGKLSGGHKGHNYTVTSPPSSILGVSEEIHNATADQLVAAKKALEILKEDISRYDIRVTSLEELEGEQTKNIKKLQRGIKKLQKKVKDTIPIEEHQDLMSAKIKSHDEVVGALEEAQAKMVEKLEDEADDLRAAVSDLNGQVGNLENDLQLAKNDLADCEN